MENIPVTKKCSSLLCAILLIGWIYLKCLTKWLWVFLLRYLASAATLTKSENFEIKWERDQLIKFLLYENHCVAVRRVNTLKTTMFFVRRHSNC